MKALLWHGFVDGDFRIRGDELSKSLYILARVDWDGRDQMYQVVIVLKVGLLLLHGGKDGLEGGDEVVEDDCSPLLALRLVESARIYDSHLLQNRRLATLTRACADGVSEKPRGVATRLRGQRTEQQQLHFALLLPTIIADSLLNLLVATTLGVCGFLAKTHYTGGHERTGAGADGNAMEGIRESRVADRYVKLESCNGTAS